MKVDMLKSPLEPELRSWQIEGFGGLDLRPQRQSIEDGRSPHLDNLVIDAHGGLRKRCGWQKLFAPVGDQPVVLMRWFDAVQGLVFASGSKIYYWREGMAPVFVGDVEHPPTDSFVAAGCLWLLTGYNYWRYDGKALQPARDHAYVPLMYSSLAADASQAVYEEKYNMLSERIRVSYVTDGSTTHFFFPKNYTYTAVESIKLDDVVLEASEYVYYTGYRYVDLINAPESGKNRLEMCLHLASAYTAPRVGCIEACRFAGVFGDGADSCVFLGGASGRPAGDWRARVQDPTYFPENAYTQIGWDDDALRGYSLQYDTMILHKAKTTWYRSLDGDGFSVKPMNDQVGCLARGSIQVVENTPVTLDRQGLFRLSGGRVRDERNMELFSACINEALLRRADLSRAISFDYNGCYGLALGDEVFVYDQQLQEWLHWSGVPAACFLVHDGRLYFGHAESGCLCRFSLPQEDGCGNDDGAPICAVWQSKPTALGFPDAYKLLRRLSLQLGEGSKVRICYRTERGGGADSAACRWHSFSFAGLDFADFSFILSDMAQTFVRKTAARRFLLLQLQLENDAADQNMEIGRLSLHYQLDKPKVR